MKLKSQAFHKFSVHMIIAMTLAGAANAGTGDFDRSLLAVFQPLPSEMPSTDNPITSEKITLGRMLYYDKRLSRDRQTSCNSCHQLSAYGVDNQQFSSGFKGQLGGRNSPTVYNAAQHIAQFWDGRAEDVEEQAKGPVLNPVEMAMPMPDKVVETLKSIPGYVDAFAKAFPKEEEAITYNNMAKAIGAFERKLVTPSRFDAFLKNDDNALTDDEKAGLKAFIEAGCITCHSGSGLGGHIYQKVGLVKPWPHLQDDGRFSVTNNEADKYLFKVPGLRNVEMTAPYMHDGSILTLEESIARMSVHQLGRQLSADQVQSIATFLKSLTGEIPVDYIKEPTLPDDVPDTARVIQAINQSGTGT